MIQNGKAFTGVERKYSNQNICPKTFSEYT